MVLHPSRRASQVMPRPWSRLARLPFPCLQHSSLLSSLRQTPAATLAPKAAVARVQAVIAVPPQRGPAPVTPRLYGVGPLPPRRPVSATQKRSCAKAMATAKKRPLAARPAGMMAQF